MHKFTKKDPSQISNMRRQSPAEDILHQYFVSSYFRTSLGFPQLKKKFRRQEKPKTFSSPTPLTYTASDSKAVSPDTSMTNAKLTGGNNPQNIFIQNTFSPSISPDDVQENKEEPPNNVNGFYFIRRSETNNLALQTPATNRRNNTAYHISEVMYYNRNMRKDANDLCRKDSISFESDSYSKRSQPPVSVPTIVVQRASTTESLHSLSSYNLSTPNTAHDGENHRGVIENKVMNAYGEVQNLSEGSAIQHSTTDSSHVNKEGESSTTSNVIPNASANDHPYPAYPILDNGRQTLDKSSSIDYSMHDQATPNIDEAKYTFLSSLFNDSGSNDPAVTKPSSNSNTIQPANTHSGNQLVNNPSYAPTPNEWKYSNGPYDAQYQSHAGGSVMQRHNTNLSKERPEEITMFEDTEDIVTENGIFDSYDDDNYNDNETSASAAPFIQYQLTTYSVTSVSRSDGTDNDANSANEIRDSNIGRDNENINAHPGSLPSNTQPFEQGGKTHPKPPPPPMSLTDILIANGQIDVANQALAVRRANAFPEPESPKSPTRKFGLNKLKKMPKISQPVLVSSTSNIKTVPIVHLNPEEDSKASSNKLQIDATGITRSIKKFKEVFAQDEHKRTLNISEPEVLMTPSLCKYFSEETLRRRFHIDTPFPVYGMEPAGEKSQGQFAKGFVTTTAIEQGKHRIRDKQLPDLPQTYNNTVPQASRNYSLRTPPTTPVSPSFTITNESTFGRAFSPNQPAFSETDEKDDAPRRKTESTVASKIFSALNNFADRNATTKYEYDLSDKVERRVSDKRGHGANASKDGKRRRRSFVKNTIIVTQRPEDTQESPETDSSYGNANNNNRITIGSQGRKWLVEQCVTKNTPTTKTTNQVAMNTEEKDSVDDHRMKSTPESFYAESLYDLYQYAEERRDSAGFSSASPQGHDETNDIWRVVNGLRLSSHVSQDNRDAYQKDAASIDRDTYYMTKRDEDVASFYRNDSYRSTFTPPPLRPVVKPHSPASNTMSSDYFLPKLGTLYGSGTTRV
ncbi:6925_t:CDS:2 [Paraglomus occultum]|uniref:6925_t:CDS:1 n=1 Tax=Paraglomus occultum TaxID=144539 RepID=A0A9N8W478_9GLOM|nr:6925_t:CDS:2 [Paraglomus occultum]